MKKNYYEILEVSKHASPEIIEKAYKTLVKKYHPDLQEGTLKDEYEQKLKLINEAYDILSDNDKKLKYDQELTQIEAREKAIHDIQIKQQAFNDKQANRNNIQNQYVANQGRAQSQIQKPINQTTGDSNNSHIQYEAQEEYNKQMNAAVKKAYHDAYIQDLKNRGYRIRYKKTFKDYIINLVALIILIAIFIILWQIPFIRKFFINMYNDNPFFKAIVNTVLIMFRK